MNITGALTFQKVSGRVLYGSPQDELLITEGLDVMRIITSPAALVLHANHLRDALWQFSQHGAPQTLEYWLNYQHFGPPQPACLFSLSVVGEQRILDVRTTSDYRRLADHSGGIFSSGPVESSVLENLADFLG